MRSKFKWIFTLLLAFSMQFSFAQEKSISGTVNEGGLPMPGVTVMVKGSTSGTQTDFDGKYTIKAKQGETLEFSFVGFKTKSVVIGTSNTINVTLEDGTEIETVEVVSTGYDRTSTKAATNSAVTTVGAKQIENRPNASFLNSLQGTAPGLTILSSSGSPGSSKIDMYIRGFSSINAATEPLIVIDGVPTNGNQFRNLNQNDIETISVLKDAAATSVYGNRGANGVLVVTTKRAKYGSSLSFTYDVITGVNTMPSNNYNLANSAELLEIEARRGMRTPQEVAELSKINTDWNDVFFGTDLTQQHNLGISFGSENTSNYISLGYFEQGGLVPGTDFKRFTLRNNFNGKSNDNKFTYSSQIALGYSKRNQLLQETNSGVNNNLIQNPLLGSLMGLPYIAPNSFQSGQELYDAIGTDFNAGNAIYVLEDNLKSGYMPNFRTESSIMANISASYKLSDNFTLTNKTAVDYKENGLLNARAPWSYLAIAVRESRGEEFGGHETIGTTKDFTFTNIASLGFSKIYNENHTVSANVYMEYMKAHYLMSQQTQDGLNPKVYTPGSGQGYIEFTPSNPESYISTAAASKIDAGSLSYFATADYDYKEKYGFGAVVRRDASYRFIEDFKWGTFWSVAGRWNIDQEAFMENSGIDMLKLRVSYGTQGNQNVLAPAYGSNPLFTGAALVRQLNATGAGYNDVLGAYYTGSLANPFLQWEEITQSNIGLDFKVLNNRLEGNIDLYSKQTDKLYNSINTSAIVGQYSYSGNNGKLRNSGIELMLKYNMFNTPDFKLSVFANGSYNKNEVIDIIENDQSGNNNVNYAGGPLSEFNLVPYVGVNQSNGNLLFLDKNNNITENPNQIEDRRLTGKSPLPKYQGGFGFNADYKGFFADAMFTWAKEMHKIDIQMLWSYSVPSLGNENLSADLLNAWTVDNPSNFPSLEASNLELSNTSDRFLYDSSFLRFKSLSFGYNFSKSFLDRTFMSSLKLYVQAENILTFTKWRGFDPESLASSQNTGYPNPKTVSFGLSVQF